MTSLLEGFWYDLSSDIETSRHLEEGTLDDLANRLAIRTTQDAVDAELLNDVLYARTSLKICLKGSWMANRQNSFRSEITLQRTKCRGLRAC